LILASLTGDGRYDGGGSVAIGLVLIGVATFLAIEVKSLLLGESADPAIEVSIRELSKRVPSLERVIHVRTVQQGPGEVLVAIKAAFTPSESVGKVVDDINAFEVELRAAHPEVKWCFVEPDNFRG
jgi:divalent metal cation (Fe/Co/Zn/Cd) transporter